MRLPVLLLASLLASGLAGNVASADVSPGDRKRADALFAAGRKLIDKDDLAACAKFGEALEIDPDAPGVLLNLGLCNENLKKYKTALYWYRKAQVRAHETNLPDYERAAGEHTTALASLVAIVTITISGNPRSPIVKIDGEEVKPDDYLRVEVDPGHHTLDAGAPGYRNVHQDFDVAGKGGETLTIPMVRGDNSIVIDQGSKRRKIAIATAIGGGVVMVVSGGLGWYAHYKYAQCIDPDTHVMSTSGAGSCHPDSGQTVVDYANGYHDLATYWGTSLFVAGVAAVGVATVIYLTAPSKERVDRTLDRTLDRTVWVPSIGPNQAGLAAVGTF